MARARRICPKFGCPRVAQGRYCPEHNREYERRRGTTTERGYGAAHQRMRRRLAPLVASGTAVCVRCGTSIAPDESWHLDHNDEDRSEYLGPAHAGCNSAAGGRRAHLTP